MGNSHTAVAPAGTAYAVLRVDRRKAKSMAAIAASSAHTMRQRPTPNANPDGPAPVVMHRADGKSPYQAVCHLLEGIKRRNRDTVLCREIVLSASPSHFRPGRESMGGIFEPDRVKAWATASLAWAKRQWPDQLASAVLHLDEQTPHMHLLVVPRVKSAEGVWKLNSKALFDRERLRELQTSYGEALAPLGIRRGEPGSMAEHAEVRKFYGAVQSAKTLPVRPTLPPRPKPPETPSGLAAGAANAMSVLAGKETENARRWRLHEEAMQQWRTKVKDVQQQDAAAWDQLRALAALGPALHRHAAKRAVASQTHQPLPEPGPQAGAQRKAPRA